MDISKLTQWGVGMFKPVQYPKPVLPFSKEQAPSPLNVEPDVTKKNPTPLPETGFLRLAQIIGDPEASPPIPAIFPVGKSTWWAGVKSGRFPKAFKLSPGITAWAVRDIRALIEGVLDND